MQGSDYNSWAEWTAAGYDNGSYNEDPQFDARSIAHSSHCENWGYRVWNVEDTFSLDVDGNGTAAALEDGLLTIRYEFGFRGATLITGAVGTGCTRCTAAAIETYLAQCEAAKITDIDGNNAIAALEDGLLTVRYEFGFTGATLITGAVGTGCTRCTAAAIEAYLGSLKP